MLGKEAARSNRFCHDFTDVRYHSWETELLKNFPLQSRQPLGSFI
jgi:hypothetical protein